jgi:uncharacterized membrane protein YfcA
LHLWVAVPLIAAMGLILGLLGGGGSILTTPILVYVLGLEAHAAILLSLIVVGSTALVGALLHQRHSEVAWKEGLLFVAIGAPLNMLGAQVSRSVSAEFLLVFFGILMGVSGMAMLFKRSDRNLPPKDKNIWPVIAAGGAVGFLAGFLGVGGGFMVVPSLVLFLGIPMKSATGTSLLVITANSAVSLYGHRHVMNVNWSPLLTLVPIALLATCLGVWLTKMFSAHMLRRAFGTFVILLGCFMILYNAGALYRRVDAANLSQKVTRPQALKAPLDPSGPGVTGGAR